MSELYIECLFLLYVAVVPSFILVLQYLILFCVCICADSGEHRGLGPSISKVRSLKMDKKVWTEELVQVYTCIHIQIQHKIQLLMTSGLIIQLSKIESIIRAHICKLFASIEWLE